MCVAGDVGWANFSRKLQVQFKSATSMPFNFYLGPPRLPPRKHTASIGGALGFVSLETKLSSAATAAKNYGDIWQLKQRGDFKIEIIFFSVFSSFAFFLSLFLSPLWAVVAFLLLSLLGFVLASNDCKQHCR